MPRASKVQAAQIEKARKLLRELPAKEIPKSREEAAATLAKEFQTALKKGYTAKDISELLQTENIPVSASLVKRCLAGKPPKKGSGVPPLDGSA